LVTPKNQNDVQGQDAPPRGSALNIETALTYARRARTQCAGLKAPLESIDVVIEQLEEVAAKIKRQRQLTAP
jgi:hypothetical protein